MQVKGRKNGYMGNIDCGFPRNFIDKCGSLVLRVGTRSDREPRDHFGASPSSSQSHRVEKGVDLTLTARRILDGNDT